MSQQPDSLSEDDVRQITQLVDALERSSFDYLQVQSGNLRVTVGREGFVPPAAPGFEQPVQAVSSAASGAATSAAHAPVVVHAPAASAVAPSAASSAHVPASAPAVATASAPAAADPSLIEIRAPIMGRYYARPDPGSPPFIAVGAQVTADSTIGLIEVMKIYTAVPAEVAGEVVEICVKDAEFIEFGQVICRVRP